MMKDLKKFLKGILFILFVSGLLLLSDLSNRNTNPEIAKENYKIVIIHWIDTPATEDVETGIFKGLADKGLIRDKNLSASIYKASGDISMLNSIIKQVLSQNPDVVFTSCTPALQAAISSIKNIPVVFTAVADPVLAGAGTDKDHHLKNITGCKVECRFDDMFRLISENAPKIKTLGSIYCPGEIISVKFKNECDQVAAKYGLKMCFFPANNASELQDAVLGMISSNIDAVCQIADNMVATGVSSVIKGVQKNNLPYFDFNPRPVGSKMESLIEIKVDYFQNGYDAAMQAIQILLEKKSPGELPFKSPLTSVIEINPAKAKSFGINFSGKARQEANIIQGEKDPFNPPKRFALVHYVLSPDCEDVTEGILERFRELGHMRNGDYVLDEYVANADITTLNDIVKVVKEKKYDLIFATVLATVQALSSKIDDVPIVFSVVADPVGNGLGKSYTDHKSNLTGIDGMSYTDNGITLIKQYIPNVRDVGVLYCPGEMASLSLLRELKKSCKKNNIRLTSIPVNSVTEISDATISLCNKKIDAICQTPDNSTIPGFSSMVKITRKHNVPLFCFISSQVKMGAIAAIAGDYYQQGKEVTDIAIEIINGKNPSTIPFSRIKNIRKVINIKAASAYGLKTPKALLNSADQILTEKIK